MSLLKSVLIKSTIQVSLVVATFLPIKAVLVAADFRIPGFIPKFISDQGAHFTALTLGVIAAIAGLLVWALKKYLLQTEFPVGSEHDIRHFTLATVLDYGRQAAISDRISARLLIGVFSLLTALVAWSLSLFFWVIIATIGAWVYLASRRATSDGDISTGARFGSFVGQASTWIAVAAAMLAVFVVDSPLGTTELLLGIVLSRQTLMILRGQLAASSNGRSVESAGSPDGEVASAGRNRGNRKERVFEGVKKVFPEHVIRLSELSLPREKLGRLSPVISGRSLTVFGEVLPDGSLGLLRYFLSEDRRMMAEELALLDSLRDASLSSGTVVETWQSGDVVGYLSHAKGISPDALKDKPAPAERVEWQSKLEFWSLSNLAIGTSSRPASWSRQLKELETHLEFLRAIPGPLQESVTPVLEVWKPISRLWNSGPPVLSFPARNGTNRLARDTSGSIVLVDPADWELLPLGASWLGRGSSQRLQRLLPASGESSDLLADAGARETLMLLKSTLRRDEVDKSQHLLTQLAATIKQLGTSE